GQSTPAGTLATLPGPVTLTWSPNTGVKLALTLCAAVMATVQLGPVLDWQAPPHAVNSLPCDAVAVRTILVPLGNSALHVVPHEMPPGTLVTLPEPAMLTSSLKTRVKL